MVLDLPRWRVVERASRHNGLPGSAAAQQRYGLLQCAHISRGHSSQKFQLELIWGDDRSFGNKSVAEQIWQSR